MNIAVTGAKQTDSITEGDKSWKWGGGGGGGGGGRGGYTRWREREGEVLFVFCFDGDILLEKVDCVPDNEASPARLRRLI